MRSMRSFKAQLFFPSLSKNICRRVYTGPCRFQENLGSERNKTARFEFYVPADLPPTRLLSKHSRPLGEMCQMKPNKFLVVNGNTLSVVLGIGES
jgi:hypothetical protein